MITAQQLMEYVHSEIASSSLYRKITTGGLPSATIRSLPYMDTLGLNFASRLSSETDSTPSSVERATPQPQAPRHDKEHKPMRPAVLERCKDSNHIFHDIQLPDVQDDICYEQHVYTQDLDNWAMICNMIDGSLKIMNIYQQERNDIVAVLEFPLHCDSFYAIRETSHEWLEAFPALYGCSNLVYIPPIPEGVKDLCCFLQDCKKFNCPIYLPSTVETCKGMLKGSDSFNSPIFTHFIPDDKFGLGDFAKFLTLY